MTTNKKTLTILTNALIVPHLMFTSCNVTAEATNPAANSPVHSPRTVIPANTQPMVNAAYLYSVLPASTIAYIRIPSLWWPIGGVAIGSIFDQVVKSAPHAEALFAIRRGILDRLVPEIPQEWRGLAKFLLSQVNTPLEIAVLAPPKDQLVLPLAVPEFLLTTGLTQTSVEAANSLLQTLVAKTPGVEFPKPLQADGSGNLLVHGNSVDVYFNALQQRLFLKIALPNPKAQSLAAEITALKPVPNHPITQATTGIDETGQGLLLWLDPQPILHLAETFGFIKEFSFLQAIGIKETRSITFGIGGSGGKQHLKLAIDLPSTGKGYFLPTLDTEIKFNAANKLDLVLMLGLPNKGYLTQLESNLQLWLSNEDYQAYQKHKTEQVPKVTGLTAEQILDTFGEMMLIHDQAGYYLALRLRDANNFQTLLKHTIQKFALKYETRDLLHTTFHHLTLPSFTQTTPSATATASATHIPVDAMGWIPLLMDQPTHVYWMERDGYLVIAGVPQVLMDIVYSTPPTNVANWLRQSQGINPAGALTLISTLATGIPRLLYEIHLWSLSYWGDLVKNPIDLFSLPSAHELNLPNNSAYSLQFITAPKQLAIEAVYESNPLEGLMSIGFQTLISTSIIAAIAVPMFITENAPESVEPVPDEMIPQQ